ncbi:ATP-dependent helicase [Candidatus Woesearchaeota archaeon]|nr:ATP-dependent helicase [Candidatus Woesearchaeota archaeon]
MISYKKKPNTEEQLNNVLNPFVKDWFFSRFKSFSLPQLFGVMEIHSRNNILVSAPTGATKTLTGFLSILNELVDSAQKGILEDKTYCVYISPLKALSNDIYKNLVEPLAEIEKINGKELGIRIGVRTGDTTQTERSKMTKNPPHILITTPESLAILLCSPKFRLHLSRVDWCIIDEIHALAENKRGVHLSLSMESLQRLSPGLCRVGLSATVSPLEEVAKFLVGNDRSCKIVDVQFIKNLDLRVVSPVDDLINTDYETLSRKTYELIDDLIHKHKTTLIFTNTRSGTERVVHHLKSKFPKKYYEIDEGPPEKVSTLIGAHHGSLSKRHRLKIEESLRKGELKAVVCSTSLELGIDIGYIDLVICLGSPKSVARFLQRAGRAGHRLHQTVKGRIIVMDRDDLVECSVLLKNAIEKKIDRLHIPTNCLDVLAQQIFGIAINGVIEKKELFTLVKGSYCYKYLSRADFNEVIDYLAGEFSKLEDRNIYAKIWQEDGKIGRRGKLARVLYMTNIGTIPDQHGVAVKIGVQTIGTIDEGFLERLKKGDIFVLGGDTYQFNYARGMVAQVNSATGKKPTVPSWFSEMLPLSFDLGVEISKFKYLMQDKFNHNVPKQEVLKFIHDFLYVDNKAAEAIYNYMREQYDYLGIPNLKWLVVEKYNDNQRTYNIFHTNLGRRVNDALSRAVAFAISRTQHRDVEIGISDNGFYVGSDKSVNVLKAFELLKSKDFRKVLERALDGSEVLKRRFRHCAGRALMILRSYKGRKKRVGRQQVSSMILLNAVKRISEDFCILKEAKREVLEDLMDISNAVKVLKWVENKDLKLKEFNVKVPSPFAFNLIIQGYSDVLRADDKLEFLKRMHSMVRAKIELDKGRKK